MSEVLGTFEQAVLLALVRLRADAYGRAILKEVQVRLKREVTADDVANAFVYLATAAKTTAAVVTVDGGNIEASLR